MTLGTFLWSICSAALAWTLEHLRMWNKLREAKAKADKAELELVEARKDVQRRREERETAENIPLYASEVEHALSSWVRENPASSSSWFPAEHVMKFADISTLGFFSKVSEFMVNQNRLEVQVSPFSGEKVYKLPSVLGRSRFL
jgi:hypothetical protein